MEAIDRLAKYLADRMGQDDEHFLIYRYSLITSVQTLSTLAITFIIAYFSGTLKWAIIVAFTASLLRSFSGGAHNKEAVTCTVLSAGLINVFALTVQYTYRIVDVRIMLVIGTLAVIIGFLTIKKYAPADTPAKPIKSEEFKRQLRFRSYAFLILLGTIIFISFLYLKNGVILSVVLGLLWQLFTLTPGGYKFLRLVDLFGEKLKGG